MANEGQGQGLADAAVRAEDGRKVGQRVRPCDQPARGALEHGGEQVAVDVLRPRLAAFDRYGLAPERQLRDLESERRVHDGNAGTEIVGDLIVTPDGLNVH